MDTAGSFARAALRKRGTRTPQAYVLRDFGSPVWEARRSFAMFGSATFSDAASAAAVLVRGADLSTDFGGRVRRPIAAADAYLDAGDADAASRLAEKALAGPGTASDQAALAAVKGALELHRGDSWSGIRAATRRGAQRRRRGSGAARSSSRLRL
jgi:hypothetical protein